MSDCVDDRLYDNSIIGNGESQLNASVSFYPIVESLNNTRATSGDAIEEIENLSIIIYDHFGNLYKLYNSTTGDITFETDTQNTQRPAMSELDEKYDGEWSDEPQATATVTFNDKLPYGKYLIYCVANMGTLTEEQVKRSDDSEFKTDVEALQNIVLTWQEKTVEVTSTGSKINNNQMFGYFTTSDKALNDAPLAGFSANEITINKVSTNIHAWIKRAASKVTLAYDGSGLYQDVFVYIKSVTIKDIPKTCLLGANNTPTKPDGVSKEDDAWPLIASGESIYYKEVTNTSSDESGEGNSKSEPTSLNGEIFSQALPGEDFHSWLMIGNGTPVYGDHSYDAPSLFFFENMQGEDKRNTKKPQLEDVNDFINDLSKDPEVRPSSYDTKDGIEMGTYIEVEAYYVSNNPENVGNGTIKYRFMLGLDDTYNYDAQRNHHFKLTLGFKGWANQPEWHIDYMQENPSVYVPDRFYMPYLYNQKADFPIRINGNCTDLYVEIVENDWGPHDPQTGQERNVPGDNITASFTPTAHMPGDYYNFRWNTTAWSNYNGMSGASNFAPYLGFLSLTAPSEIIPTKILEGYSYRDGVEGYEALQCYYEAGNYNALTLKNFSDDADATKYPENLKNFIPQNKRFLKIPTDLAKKYLEDVNSEHPEAFQAGSTLKNSNDISWNQCPVTKDKYGYDVTIPLFTRPMSMIYGSLYSGSNPFAYNIRYAKIKIKATFVVKDPDSGENVTKFDEKEVEIFQVPRITNPKAIWRMNNSEKNSLPAGDEAKDLPTYFNITLMTRQTIVLNADYSPFTSYGSWTADLEGSGKNNFKLIESGGSYMPGNTTSHIEGRSGSQIKFNVEFNGGDANGIITIKYNGGSCTHKVFLRQGYGSICVNDPTLEWNSYNIFKFEGTPATNAEEVTTTLTKSPMSIGSLFKKCNYQQGILISNNKEYGPLAPLNGYLLNLTNGTSRTWGNVSRPYNQNAKWASRFKIGSDNNWRVPTFAEFKKMTRESDYGFGVLYGDGADETKTICTEAEGFMDETGVLNHSKYGVRGVIVYNNDAESNYYGNQIFFSIGEYGQGRRCYYTNTYNGVLLYGDVTQYPLSGGANDYRPLVYNLAHQPGAIYWIYDYKPVDSGANDDIDKNVLTEPCLGWDINYYTLDFSQYSDRCYRDALPIKLVKTVNNSSRAFGTNLLRKARR